MITPDDFPSIGAFTRNDETAGALTIIEDHDGRVLLQLRDQNAQTYWPGKWGFIGGGIEAGETILQAALREIEEETGLTPDASALVPFAKTNSQSRHHASLYVFHAVLDVRPADIRLGEGSGFAFWNPSQLPHVDILDSIVPVIELFLSRTD